MAIPSEFPFLYHGYENIVHSSSILNSAANLLVRHMVFEGIIQKPPIAPHPKGLDPSFFPVLLSRSTSYRHKGRRIR